MSLSFIILQENLEMWKLPIKTRMGNAHSSFWEHTPHAGRYVCDCVPAHAFGYITCLWHVCSLKPKGLQGDHSRPTKTRPKKNVSPGASSLASRCCKKLRSSIRAVPRAYQILWAVLLPLKQRHAGSTREMSSRDSEGQAKANSNKGLKLRLNVRVILPGAAKFCFYILVHRGLRW